MNFKIVAIEWLFFPIGQKASHLGKNVPNIFLKQGNL